MEIEGSKTARVVLVTGGNGTIGYAISKAIAALPGYEVVLAVRDQIKGEEAVRSIKQETGNQRVRFELFDVSRWESVYDLAARWEGPIHVLINNAAITTYRFFETPGGIELQFATNVLGYFWMMRAFTDHLRRSAPARIVNVASFWAGDLVLDDLEFKRRRYQPDLAYRQSKQADRMLTAAFAEQLKPFGISVNSCHPGVVSSRVSRNLGFVGHETPEQAARTPVWLATDPDCQQVTGQYFEYMQPVDCQFCQDWEEVEGLYQACLAYG